MNLLLTTCFGLLCKGRYPSNQPNIICHRNDQLFIAAGLKRSMFKVFNKMCLCNSYVTALRKNMKLSDGFDEKVLSWKRKIEFQYAKIEMLKITANIVTTHQENLDVQEIMKFLTIKCPNIEDDYSKVIELALSKCDNNSEILQYLSEEHERIKNELIADYQVWY